MSLAVVFVLEETSLIADDQEDNHPLKTDCPMAVLGAGFPHGGSKNFPLSRLLNKNYETQIARLQSGRKLRLEVNSEIASLLKFADFLHFDHNGDVGQLLSAIFAAKHSRFSAVQGDGAVHIPAVFLDFTADFDMCAKNGWGSSFHAERADRHGHHGCGS